MELSNCPGVSPNLGTGKPLYQVHIYIHSSRYRADSVKPEIYSSMDNSAELAETTSRDRAQREDGIGDDNAEHDQEPLSPVDGGRAAWKLLFAAYVFEALLWGK